VHTSHKKAILVILNSPGFIKFECKVPECGCGTCRLRISESAIKNIRLDILKEFQGLCLDCIKKTKNEGVDDDYWEHDMKKKWDADCRIAHGQPTWYFSFMGRKTDMKNNQQIKKAYFKGMRSHFSGLHFSDSE
jgi:hypothetical protein